MTVKVSLATLARERVEWVGPDSGKGEIPKSDRAEIGAVLNLIQRGVAVWPIHRARSLRDGSSRPKNPCADKPASSNIRLLCSASGPLFCLVLRDEPVHLFLDFSSAPHHTSWLQIAARCVRPSLFDRSTRARGAKALTPC